jgi:hypothetical protein
MEMEWLIRILMCVCFIFSTPMLGLKKRKTSRKAHVRMGTDGRGPTLRPDHPTCASAGGGQKKKKKLVLGKNRELLFLFLIKSYHHIGENRSHDPYVAPISSVAIPLDHAARSQRI